MVAKINNEPLISIIMTSYNYAGLLPGAIESVIDQSYRNWELIIVDDGSTDNSLEIIEEYTLKHDNICLFTHPNHENRGLSESLILATGKVRGPITAFLESDDCWLPDNLLAKAGLLMNNPNLTAVFSSLELTGDNISRKYPDYIRYVDWAGRKVNSMKGSHYKLLLLRNPAATFSNILIRSALLKEISIGAGFEKWLDWQILTAASLLGNVKYIDKKLICWRIHSHSLHYQYMAEAGEKELSRQKAGFLENIPLLLSRGVLGEGTLTTAADIKKYLNSFSCKFTTLRFNLGFALRHPVVALRKAFNLYEY